MFTQYAPDVNTENYHGVILKPLKSELPRAGLSYLGEPWAIGSVKTPVLIIYILYWFTFGGTPEPVGLWAVAPLAP